MEVKLALPSRAGMTVAAELSVLSYRVKEDMVKSILENIGEDYESSLVLTAPGSASADVASRHAAKAMHSGARSEIEEEIAAHLNQSIGPRGFEVEQVLLESIELPKSLAEAV